MKVLGVILFAFVLAIPQTATGQTPAPAEVSFGSTGPNSSDWPYYIADAMGYFRQAGLHVTEIQTGNPIQTINELATGAVNVATDGTDTIVAALAHHLPVKIVAPQMIDDPFALVVSPSITSWAALKGKTITLATKEDVTAISFMRMAAANHLDMTKDFSIVLAGTTNLRYAALNSGSVQGALLAQPFDFQAEASGMRILARSATYMKDWMYKSVVVNTTWAAAHRSEVARFIRALRRGADYGYGHPEDAIRILIAATKSDPVAASKAYTLDFVTSQAFSRSGIVPMKGLRAVIDAMVGVGVIPVAPPISDVLDASFAQEAQRLP